MALANLKNNKPRRGQETAGFTKETETLAGKLKQAYIREEVPNEVATKLANKAAIQTLITASQKQETKMLLKVGKFDSFSEALNIVVENEYFSNEPSASIMHMKRNFAQNRPNYSTSNQRQSRPNFGPQQNRFGRNNHFPRNNHNNPMQRQPNWNHANGRRIFQMNEAHGSLPLRFTAQSVPVLTMNLNASNFITLSVQMTNANNTFIIDCGADISIFKISKINSNFCSIISFNSF